MFKKILHILEDKSGIPDPRQEVTRQLLPHPDLSKLSPLFDVLALQHSYGSAASAKSSTGRPATAQQKSVQLPEPASPPTISFEASMTGRAKCLTIELRQAYKESEQRIRVTLPGGGITNTENILISALPATRPGPGATLTLLTGTSANLDADIAPIQLPSLSSSDYTLHLTQGTLLSGSALQLNSTAGHWALLYLISGQLLICQESVYCGQLIIFEKENDELLVRACKDSQFLWMILSTETS